MFVKQHKDGRQRAFAEAAAKLPDNPDTSCVIWPYAMMPHGYGTLEVNGKTMGVHVYVTTIVRGPRPPKADACHSCNNRPCINPAHLRWGSRKDNMADAIVGNTTRRGSRNWNVKLTEEQVRAIRADRRTIGDIARSYGVVYATIKDILIGENWGWLK